MQTPSSQSPLQADHAAPSTQTGVSSQGSPAVNPYLPTDPPPPPVSKKNRPTFHDAHHRTFTARAFEQGAAVYDEIRPGYPHVVLDLVTRTEGRCLDVGCGTGKLTEQMIDRGLEVSAIDPSRDMLRVLRSKLDVPAWCATAEATALADHSIATITCAQTWHWVDPIQASAECARVTDDDGELVLVWNTLDVSIPWVHRLSRIMHSGDTLKAGFYPEVHSPWQLRQEIRSTWEQQLLPGQIHDLTHTRSYWIRANEKTRQKVTSNLDWYLFEHLQLDPHVPLSLPYRLDAFRYTKN